MMDLRQRHKLTVRCPESSYSYSSLHSPTPQQLFAECLLQTSFKSSCSVVMCAMSNS